MDSIGTTFSMQNSDLFVNQTKWNINCKHEFVGQQGTTIFVYLVDWFHVNWNGFGDFFFITIVGDFGKNMTNNGNVFNILILIIFFLSNCPSIGNTHHVYLNVLSSWAKFHWISSHTMCLQPKKNKNFVLYLFHKLFTSSLRAQSMFLCTRIYV